MPVKPLLSKSVHGTMIAVESFSTQDVRPVATIIQLNSVFGRDFTQKSCPKISTPAPSDKTTGN
jgi:hypothetical protein